MTTPLISVIVPVYNTEKYISRCINSITNQSFTDFEIICVDDCSSDNSYSILTHLAQHDNRIKLYRNAENHGAGYTKNYAINRASGEYICFVDSDDWIVEGALGILYETAVKSNVDDVFHLLYNMNESEGKLISESSSWHMFENGCIYSGLEFLTVLLDERLLSTVAPLHFVRRKIVQKVSSFSIGTENDDMQFVCNLLAHLKTVLFLNKELYVYFHREAGSISNIPLSTEHANEMVFIGINLYCSINRIGTSQAKKTAQKLLRHSFSLAKKYYYTLPKAKRHEFALDVINNNQRYRGLYVEIAQKSLEGLRGLIYIYGAGQYALDIYLQLKDHKVNVKAFLVSKKEKIEIDDIPILCISDFSVPKNATLIIGTSEKFYDEILALPKVRQFSNCILARDL